MVKNQVEVYLLFCCPYQSCNKEYKSKFNLRRHVQYNHLGNKPFACTVCERNFVSKQNLAEHEFIHKGLKPYKCTECGLKFRYYSQISVHRRIHEANYEDTLNFVLAMQVDE